MHWTAISLSAGVVVKLNSINYPAGHGFHPPIRQGKVLKIIKRL